MKIKIRKKLIMDKNAEYEIPRCKYCNIPQLFWNEKKCDKIHDLKEVEIIKSDILNGIPLKDYEELLANRHYRDSNTKIIKDRIKKLKGR